MKLGMMTSVTLATMTVFTAQAQTTGQSVFVSPPPMVIGQQEATRLLAGTQIPLRTTTHLTTKGKKLKVGHRFNLETVEPITLNGVTVIPAGSLAVGEVTHVRNKGMFGKSGAIDARLLYVRANNRQLRISGQLDDKGAANGAVAGIMTSATLIGGLVITGTSAEIPIGTPVTGYLDEDMPVVFAPNVRASAPMVAPAPAAPPSLPATGAQQPVSAPATDAGPQPQ